MMLEMSLGCLAASSKSNYSSLWSSKVLNAISLSGLQIYHLGQNYHSHPCRQLHAVKTVAGLITVFWSLA